MFYSYCVALGTALLLSLPALAQTNDTIPVDKHQYWLFHPTPRQYMRPMVPDRPGITESPYTVDAGHFQLESDAFRLINERDDDTRDRNLYLNHVLLKIGLTDKTDFQLGINSYTINRHWDTPDAATPNRQARFGDMTLRLKRNILGDDNRRFALATIGYVRLPTGKQVGDGAVEYGLLVPIVYKLPHNWNVGAQAQAERMYDRDADTHFVLVTPSVTVDREFTPWLAGFVELVGYWNTKEGRWRSSVNLGPQFDVGDNLQFDFGTHLSLTRQIDNEYFVGFSFRI